MERRWLLVIFAFVCQAEDGIRDLVRSRGLGDVYKRQAITRDAAISLGIPKDKISILEQPSTTEEEALSYNCLLYTSDAADERSSVDLGGRRIIKKKNTPHTHRLISRN